MWPVKSILTERLRLSPLRVEDARSLLALFQDPRIYEFISDSPPDSLSDLEEWFHLEKGQSHDGSQIWLNWIATIRPTRLPVGWFQATIYNDYTADIAYVAYILFPQYCAKDTLARRFGKPPVS